MLGMWHRAREMGVWLPRNLQSVETNQVFPETSQQTNKKILGRVHTVKKMEQDRETRTPPFKMLLLSMSEAIHVQIQDTAIKTVKAVSTRRD